MFFSKILKFNFGNSKGILEKLSLFAPAGIVRIVSENKDNNAITSNRGNIDGTLVFFFTKRFFFTVFLGRGSQKHCPPPPPPPPKPYPARVHQQNSNAAVLPAALLFW